jgi:hypothetical protein
MKKFMLRWIYEAHSFWGLKCYACGSCEGWRTSFCDWRSNSCIAVATCRECGTAQFLKKYRHPGNAEKNPAKWEYEVLRHLDRGLGSAPAFLLPRAYIFSATECAFSMEYIEGEPMDVRMRQARNRQAFDDCLSVSAAWLRGLHGARPLHDKTGGEHTTMLLRLDSDCAPLASRNALVAQALTCMRRSLAEINTLPLKHVPLHGDFKASNLIWARTAVYGIDVGLRFNNPGVIDAAQFIADVLLSRCSIQAIAAERDVAPIFDVFLKAYGNSGRPARNLLSWWLLYFLLSRWQGDLAAWKPSIYVDKNYIPALADVMTFCNQNRAA